MNNEVLKVYIGKNLSIMFAGETLAGVYKLIDVGDDWIKVEQGKKKTITSLLNTNRIASITLAD